MGKQLLSLLFILSFNIHANQPVDSSHEEQSTEKLTKKIYSLNESQEKAQLLKQLIKTFFEEEQHDSALKYAIQLKQQAEKLNNDTLLAYSYSRLGVINQYLGRYIQANEYNFLGLNLKKKLGLGPRQIAESHDNIALSYQELGPFEKVIEHQKYALKNYYLLNDTQAIASSYSQIGAALYQQKEYDSAKVYYDKAYSFYKQLGNKEYEAVYYIYMGLIYLKTNHLKKSVLSYQSALKTFPEDGSKRMKIFIYSNLAVSHLVIGAERDSISTIHLKKAIKAAHQTYQMAEEISFIHQMRKASEVLYKAYDALQEYDKAIKHGKQFIHLNDSIYNQEKINAITETRTKYETKEKEHEIELLEKDLEIKSAQINQAETKERQKTILLLAVISVLSISIFFSIFIYRLFQQKKTAARTLEENNKIIKQQAEENEVLLKEIHHRVKNNLQVIGSLLDLQSFNISDKQALSAITDGQTRVKAMALIHQNLYQNNEIGSIDFNKYVNELVRQIASVFEEKKKITVEISSKPILIDIDTAIPLGLILNELISNAYKYAFKSQDQGHISIKIKEEEQGNYLLTLKDNGKGLPDDFKIEKSSSLGLRLVKRLCKQLYGSMHYENEGGAVFYINFKDNSKRKSIA